MARLIDQVFGHEVIKESLIKMTAEKKFFNSVIFSGPEGIGKKKLAMALLQEINCEKKLACGECQNCQKMASSADVFLRLIEPQGDKIKIEQIRDVIDFLSLKAWVPHRFVIVNGIEKITAQAANALLKSVEEPPEGVHFIFIAANLSQVLSTIRSRSQVVQFSALSRQTLQSIVAHLDTWQAQWSFGRVSLAEKICQEEWQEVRKAAINFLHSPQHAKVQEAMGRLFTESEKIEFIIHCWMTYIRDAWQVSAGDRNGLYNADIVAFVEKFSQRQGMSELYDSLMQIREDVLGNVDKHLILDNFAIRLAGGY
jgi:DNA polymerase-3 subunit delta'